LDAQDGLDANSESFFVAARRMELSRLTVALAAQGDRAARV
jgi:hypothetical protein